MSHNLFYDFNAQHSYLTHIFRYSKLDVKIEQFLKFCNFSYNHLEVDHNFGLGHGRARALSHTTKIRSDWLGYLKLVKASHDIFVKNLYHYVNTFSYIIYT